MNTFHATVPEREGPSDTLASAVFSIIAPGGTLPPQTTYVCGLGLSAEGRCHRWTDAHAGVMKGTDASDGCTGERRP